MEPIKRKRNKQLIVYVTLLLLFVTCNAKQHKAVADDCDCKKVKVPPAEQYPFVFDSLDEFDSLVNQSYPINLVPTKDSTVIGIWFEEYMENMYLYEYIYYYKNYKLYRQTIHVSTFENMNILGFLIDNNFTNEYTATKYNNKNILVEKKLYDKKIFDNSYDFISLKDSILINDALSLKVRSFSRKIDSITQPITERKSYIAYCQKADSNTIGWFPGGGIMSRPYKKNGSYYMMFMSGGGWECLPVDFSQLPNGDMRLDGGPFGIYYIISKDKSEFKQYSASDKLISTDKRQVHYDYMDYTTYYLFHTIYGYNGPFIPYLPKQF